MKARERVMQTASDLVPSSFALVMATGIVALDIWVNFSHTLAIVLIGYAVLMYVILLGLSVLRAVHFTERVRDDMAAPGSTFAFLTFVAGSGVLASSPVFAHDRSVTAILGAIGICAWLVLVPAAASTALRLPKGTHHQVARGNWLLAVVATQSMSIVAALLAQEYAARILMVVGLLMGALGLVLYPIVIVHVGRRMLYLLRHSPTAITGDYWITMGALAITMLSISRLLETITVTGEFDSFAPGLRVAGCVVWVVCTTWIPLLVFTEVRMLQHGRRPSYDPNRWSTVFPLGMYAAGSGALGITLNVDFMTSISHVFVVLAIIAWVCVTAGFFLAVSKAV